MILGIFLQTQFPDDAHNLQQFAGMLTGFGCGVLAVGVVFIIRRRFSTPEKLREREIEQKDERNIQIMRAAYATAALGAFILFALLTFIFTLMGEFTACIITLVAMYIDIAVFVISYLIFQKKM
jgi:hypothetical protein